MKYEIYIDSLFLLNLGMNLYLLELTNCILHHAAAWKRVVLGAVCGTIFSVLPLLLPLNFMFAGSAGFLLSLISMMLVTFKVSGLGAYLHLLEVLSVMTIVLGAVLQYLIQRIPKHFQMSGVGILLLGAVCFIILRCQMLKSSKNSLECKVTLWNDRNKVRVNAIVDTGNSLIEPISGAPVAVLDKKVFESLFLNDKPTGFRVIPYHSIDKKAGLLPGYLIPEMHVEREGICREFHNIYVGIRPQGMGETEYYKMIINPDMLKERKTG